MGEAKKVSENEVESKPKRDVLGGDTDANRLEADSAEVELKTKVKAMVDAKFGGDFKKAFDAYDGDHDGAVSKGELQQLLADADVGNRVTRGMWAKGVIGKMDTGGDQKIQWSEFQAAIAG